MVGAPARGLEAQSRNLASLAVGTLSAGTQVEAAGLARCPEYNGMQGVCTGEKDGNRWTVKL